MKQTDNKNKALNMPVIISRVRQLGRFLKWPVILAIITAVVVIVYKQLPDNSHFNYPLILQYIDVLKWPAIVLLVLVLIKPHLPSLMTRITEFAFAGMGAKFKENPQPQPTIEGAEEASAEIEQQTPSGQTSSPPADLLDNVEVKYLFEKIYRLIFGTQITALKRLADHHSGLHENDFNNLLEQHRAQLAPTNNGYTDVRGLLSYPANNYLLELNPSTSVYHLTELGRLFLRYLSDEGILDAHKGL